MSALLPCPFCGGVADLRESNIPRSFGCRVGCDACGIYTTNIGSDLNIPEVKASTVAAWNTRAAASAPQPVSAWLPIESAMPKFGDRIKNPWASDDNPTKVGIFVRQFRRTGKLNPGTIWEFTDGNGKFWEINKRSFFEKRDE